MEVSLELMKLFLFWARSGFTSSSQQFLRQVTSLNILPAMALGGLLMRKERFLTLLQRCSFKGLRSSREKHVGACTRRASLSGAIRG